MSYNVKKHGEVISTDIRTSISTRYKAVTKAINREFWDSQSDKEHSLYVGSYDEEQQLIPVMLIFLLNYLKMNTIAITFIREMGSPDYCKL